MANSLKAEGVDVGVFEEPAEFDGFASERRDIGADFPCEGVIQGVAAEGLAFGLGEAGDGLTVSVVDFDRHFA